MRRFHRQNLILFSHFCAKWRQRDQGPSAGLASHTSDRPAGHLPCSIRPHTLPPLSSPHVILQSCPASWLFPLLWTRFSLLRDTPKAYARAQPDGTVLSSLKPPGQRKWWCGKSSIPRTGNNPALSWATQRPRSCPKEHVSTELLRGVTLQLCPLQRPVSQIPPLCLR